MERAFLMGEPYSKKRQLARGPKRTPRSKATRDEWSAVAANGSLFLLNISAARSGHFVRARITRRTSALTAIEATRPDAPRTLGTVRTDNAGIGFRG
jgi:hypothetical protein